MNVETSQELRGLVREVLRETLAKRVTPVQGIEAVDLSTEAALQAFVNRLATPGVIEAVRAGKLRFTLSDAKMESAPISVSGAVIEGVINERRVDSLAGAGKLILGPTAVLTPLARDRARKLGLKIERSR
ncbi:MAG: hypothetical protein ABIN69_05660 [Aestuariivirga sp.]